MPDAVLISLFLAGVIAWGVVDERRMAKERRMERELAALAEESGNELFVIEAAPTGRKFERRFNEEGASWEALEEEHALRVLACSFGNVPALLDGMQTGEPVRTPFAEYRLVQ